MKRKIKIALAEDMAINRQNFLRKLKEMPDCELAFIANDGHDCLQQLKGLPQSQKPEVVFMDLEMPGMGGIEAIQIAKQIYPSIHFLILTVFDDDDKVFAALQAGAEGYLLKHESVDVLLEALENVVTIGGVPMSPAIARKALALLRRANLPDIETSPPTNPHGISERELEVLEHMVSGLDAKSIATNMNLSVFTVRKHIANVYEKLHVNSKAQVMTLAHKEGWFRAD